MHPHLGCSNAKLAAHQQSRLPRVACGESGVVPEPVAQCVIAEVAAVVVDPTVAIEPCGIGLEEARHPGASRDPGNTAMEPGFGLEPEEG